MEESKTGRIHVKDVDASIFEEFLHFVYCGDVFSSKAFEDKQLLQLEDMYQAIALKRICQVNW